MKQITNSPFSYYLKKYKKFFSFGCLALIITDVSDILAPYIMGVLLDRFQSQQNLDNTAYLFGALILASFTTAGFRYLWRVNFAKFHHSVALDLRLLCYKSYFKQDLINFESKSTGDKMSIFTKDIENFRMGIGPGFLILLDALLYLILIPIAMWQLNPKWTLILIFIAPIIPVVIALMEKKLNSLFNKRQAELSELSSLAQESLEGIKVIKSFRMEKFRESLYDKENKKLFKTSTNLDFLHSSFSPVLEFFVSTSCAALLFSVAYYSDLDNLKIGSLFAFYQYMQRMTWPLTALGLSYMMISEAKSSFRRIAPVIDPKNHQAGAHPTDRYISKIEDLNFNYPDEKSFFKNLHLSLENGKSYLITGKTKAGKTTLFNILNGLLETESQIKRSSDSVSNPQIPFLFMDTVDSNISISNKKISSEDLKAVAFEKEYRDLPFVGDTRVGEKGTSLSGGQKQRLSLLRALKTQSKILFLDEPMSAVDEKTKDKLITTLKEQKQKGTDFVIATSNPEHYTWLDEVIIVSEDSHSQERKLETVKMSQALKQQNFQKLLRKIKTPKAGGDYEK